MAVGKPFSGANDPKQGAKLDINQHVDVKAYHIMMQAADEDISWSSQLMHARSRLLLHENCQ